MVRWLGHCSDVSCRLKQSHTHKGTGHTEKVSQHGAQAFSFQTRKFHAMDHETERMNSCHILKVLSLTSDNGLDSVAHHHTVSKQHITYKLTWR